MRKFLKIYFSIFFVLGIIFIPLNFQGHHIQFKTTEFLFSGLTRFIQNQFFPSALNNVEFSSDTIALNILIAILLFAALFITAVLYICKYRNYNLWIWLRLFATYYIVYILAKYGFEKIFKQQFYLPEPNILYSPFGLLSKDILYWSVLGTSHTYNVAVGTIEIITATLILINRTRVLGLCLALFVFINIIIVNFSFDISVKTFSIFLFMMTVYLVYPSLKNIYLFFTSQNHVKLFREKVNSKKLFLALQGSFGLLLLTQIFYPYYCQSNFNDDNLPRPKLHGAYEVSSFIIGTDTLDQLSYPYKRLFIHRQNYLILQKQDDEMEDYFFEPDYGKKELKIVNYDNKQSLIRYQLNKVTGMLIFNLEMDGNHWEIQCKSLNWKKLPALQNDFHYTIDDIH